MVAKFAQHKPVVSLCSSQQRPQFEVTRTPLLQRINVILNIKHLSSPICFYSWEKKSGFGKFLIRPKHWAEGFWTFNFFVVTTRSSFLCRCLCAGRDLNPWIITEKWLLWAVQRKVWSSLVVAVVSSLCFAGLSSFLVFSKWQMCTFSVVL